MTIKGVVNPNHTPINNFKLIVVGLPPILFTKISGLEEETDKVKMPDRTLVSGGNVNHTEFTALSFEHHTVEHAAMKLWQKQGQDPVDPLYKKVGTLIKYGIDGKVASTRTLMGLWVTKSKEADLDLEDEGKPAMTEWSLSADKVLPV